MSLLKLSDQEKEKIKQKHKEATQKDKDKKDELKKGLQKPKQKTS